MSIKVIPEQQIWVCDFCQREEEPYTPFKRDGFIKLERRHDVDHQGNAILGTDKSEYDLCDSCLRVVEQTFAKWQREWPE